MSEELSRAGVTDPRDQEIIEHYDRFFGPHTGITRFSKVEKPAPDPIFVVEYAPSSQEKNYVYLTTGMSRLPMSYPPNWPHEKPERRAELMLKSRRRHEELPPTLFALAKYPFQRGVFLGIGQTIPGDGQTGVVMGSPLTDMFVMSPFELENGLSIIHHGDGTHTQVLLVVPIYPSERQYKLQHGAEALENLLRRDSPDPANFWRPPAI